MILAAGAEIHLDSSFLIRALVSGTREMAMLERWHRGGKIIGICALAWGEFLCGPLGLADVQVARRLILRYVPVRTEEAAKGADLFNRAGRRSRSYADCVIAATAIVDGASLATSDPRDFARFTTAGLVLAE